nr:integrase, catalytic region, zinc finger, CCHC-type, peptidase aspartic, catalytic [Tanacetum cinerariifolium]
MGQTNQIVHMIISLKDNLYNGRKGIGFENPSYFEKAKDLRPTFYDEKVTGLGSLKPYVPNVILDKIIIDLEDEVVNLLEKEKVNLETTEPLKSKGVESSETVSSESENQSENVCHVVEKQCDTFSSVRRPKNSGVIWKKKGLSNTSNVGLSAVSVSKLNKNVKRYSRKDLLAYFEKIDSPFQQTSSLKPYVPNVILEKIIIDLEDKVVSLLEKEKAKLETIESLKSKGFESSENGSSESKNQTKNDCLVVEKEYDKEENPKKKKWSSNISNVGLSAVSVSNLNKNVKRYSRKDLLACNNSNLGETRSDFMCNDTMNVSCNPRMCDLLDDNNFFIFDDVNVKISHISKMPFRKKPRDSMHIVQICLWIIDSGCSKHMTGNRALLTNFVEKFLGTVRFGNNDFAVIAGYGDVVIGSMTIKKVYYVEGLRHNLFSVGQFCYKGLEVAFQKST